MMNLKRLFSTLCLLALAACGGGGGGGGTSPFGNNNPGGGNPGTVAGIDVQLSSPTVVNSGLVTVTATITTLDANRNAVPNVAVVVSTTDSSALITLAGSATQGSSTGASGTLPVTVAIGSNHSNRPITITATAGAVSGSATLQVVDGAAGALPAAIEVIAGANSVGTGGDGVQIRVFVKDASNNALPSAPVSFRTSSGTLSGVSSVTDASGSAVATLSAGADRSNREAVVTVTSGTAPPGTITLPITGTKLTLSGPSALVLNTTANFDVVVTDSKSNVVSNVALTATSSLGNSVTNSGGGLTNVNGLLRFSYTATNAGPDNLVFRMAGTPPATASPNPSLVVSGQDFTFGRLVSGNFVADASSQQINVNSLSPLYVRLRNGGTPQMGVTVNFAATGGSLTPTSAAVTDGAGVATVNLTSTSAGPVTVQATASVAGATVTTTVPVVVVATTPSKLVLQINPTAIAPNVGTATTNQAQVTAKVTDAAGNPVAGQVVNFTRVSDPSGGNLLQASSTTDSSGQATVAYRAGSESTANNGVILSGTVASAPSVSGTASLTVNQTALFIALGTGNTIIPLPGDTTYQKDWVVYVTDSNGIPVNGVTLTIKAIPTHYITGRLRYNGTVWEYADPINYCRNEDSNFNGILDATEDDNGDLVLWPGNVISVTPGTIQTVNGRATVSLIYAESYVPWVRMKLTASATVSGTESKTDAEFIVTGLDDDFSSEIKPPAGFVSPFGLVPKGGAVCSLTAP